MQLFFKLPYDLFVKIRGDGSFVDVELIISPYYANLDLEFAVNLCNECLFHFLTKGLDILSPGSHLVIYELDCRKQ